jgi:peroxiredoxin-like protein
MGHLEASASVRWSGWEGTISGQSGTLNARTATQAELGGPGTGTNPEELLAAAHANCFTSTLTSLGRARAVALEEVTTRAKTRLEWDDEAHDHHLARSELSLTIRSSSPEDEVRALVRETEERCPVCKAISGNVPMLVSLEIQPVR